MPTRNLKNNPGSEMGQIANKGERESMDNRTGSQKPSLSNSDMTHSGPVTDMEQEANMDQGLDSKDEKASERIWDE